MKVIRCSDCSINVFMSCLFDNKIELLNGGDFDKIFTEYLDISGIGETKEFDLMQSVHNIHTRILWMETMITVQKEFFKNFDMPFVDAFPDFLPYGHKIIWDPENPDLWVKQMERMETIEKKYQAQLDKAQKELKAFKKDGVQKDSSGSGRRDFIRQLNNLGKAGYRIDKDKTNMEELALMIKDQSDLMMEQARRKNNT